MGTHWDGVPEGTSGAAAPGTEGGGDVPDGDASRASNAAESGVNRPSGTTGDEATQERQQ